MTPKRAHLYEFEGIASANVGARFSVVGIEWMEFAVSDRDERRAAETPA